jgi:hypothetical protein
MQRIKENSSSMDMEVPTPTSLSLHVFIDIFRYTPMSITTQIQTQLQIEKENREIIIESFYAWSKSGTDTERPMPYNRHFLVVHFGAYAQAENGMLPAEFCIADFSVRDGINHFYSRMLDSGT